MSAAAPGPHGSDRAWRLTVGSITAGLILIAALFGFIILPLTQPRPVSISGFIAICSAIGLRPSAPALATQAALKAAPGVSQVAWTLATLRRIDSGDPAKGKTAAAVCTSCHGEHGIVSPQQEAAFKPMIIPDIGTLDRASLYKELSDFRSGSRKSTVMGPLAQSLSEGDMLNVIAYFAAPAGAGSAFVVDWSPPRNQFARLVERGDPTRGLPPCASCHESGTGGPVGAPTLKGQQAAYLEEELRAFASGQRANDIYDRMRDVAGKLTAAEITGIAKYYAAP